MSMISAAELDASWLDPVLDAQGRPRRELVVVDVSRVSDADARRAAAAIASWTGPKPVLVGVADGSLPSHVVPLLAALSFTLADHPSPYCAGAPGDLESVERLLSRAPVAAAMLDSVLRAPSTTFQHAMLTESLAYSVLLSGPEFSSWLAVRRARTAPPVTAPVTLTRDGDTLSARLNWPERRNAMGHAMRDALFNALEVATADASIRTVVVSGAGPSFCSGGDLDEFGTAHDPATAHLVRLHRSIGSAVHTLGDRVRFEVHGPCVGAGVELPAFARRVVARRDATFRLPELEMGLIPGAGGTVSLPGRIGRWRTAFLAMTATTLDAETARTWGLVDELR